jgi:hypothetical protein
MQVSSPSLLRFSCLCSLHSSSRSDWSIEIWPTLRKGYIVVHRGPLIVNEETGQGEFQPICFRGRVIDRVYPGGKSLAHICK